MFISRILCRHRQACDGDGHIPGMNVAIHLLRLSTLETKASREARPCIRVGILPFHLTVSSQLTLTGLFASQRRRLCSHPSQVQHINAMRLSDGCYPLPVYDRSRVCPDFPPPITFKYVTKTYAKVMGGDHRTLILYNCF